MTKRLCATLYTRLGDKPVNLIKVFSLSDRCVPCTIAILKCSHIDWNRPENRPENSADVSNLDTQRSRGLRALRRVSR